MGQFTTVSEWSDLVFGRYSVKTVLEAVEDPEWQSFRASLKRKPLPFRHSELHRWLTQHQHSHRSKVQVTNYVNALKRGGTIKEGSKEPSDTSLTTLTPP